MYYFLGTITNQDEDERPLAWLMRRAIRKGDVFLDIGANVGFYSFFVGPLCGTTGAVHAFEANPLLIPHLRRSAALNKHHANIVINAVAVGKDSNSFLKLYDPEHIGNSSIYDLEWLDTSKSVRVPSTTVDLYVRENSINRVDVVKIDIEGAELDAFRGMEETFRSSAPWLIVCELALAISLRNAPTRSDQHTSRCRYAVEVVQFLCQRGYEARHINQTDGLISDRVDVSTLQRLSQNLINVAFVRPDLQSRRPDLFASA
jgi:FkbM family methyltransferase